MSRAEVAPSDGAGALLKPDGSQAWRYIMPLPGVVVLATAIAANWITLPDKDYITVRVFFSRTALYFTTFMIAVPFLASFMLWHASLHIKVVAKRTQKAIKSSGFVKSGSDPWMAAAAGVKCFRPWPRF